MFHLNLRRIILVCCVFQGNTFPGLINELANVISELQSSLVAVERVFVLLDTRPEPEDATDARAITYP